MDKYKKTLKLVAQDIDRNERFLHLTPNESVLSNTARKFQSTRLSDRYYFGPGESGVMDNGTFTALGLAGVGDITDKAEEALKKMVGAEVVNLNCLSGIHAMMCVLLSTTNAGDTVMTLHHNHGGHFATKGIIERAGRKSIDAVFDSTNRELDIKATTKVFKNSNAKLFYIDISYITDTIDISKLRSHLGEEALIAYDASHTIGLIMGEALPSPLANGVDIMCANTHKTLPGSQKGLIAFKDASYGQKINKLINSCLFSSTHTGSLIALAITILEMESYGKAYAKQVQNNSQALGEALQTLGFEIRKNPDGSFSRTHQVHLLTDRLGERRSIYDTLYQNSIASSFDSPRIQNNGNFIRLGTQEITRRGMKEEEMAIIANLIKQALDGKDVKEKVESLKSKFSSVQFSFDNNI